MASSEDASSGDQTPRPSANKAEDESAGSPKAWFITWDGSTCQELPAASLVGARAPEPSKLFETPSGANAEAVGTRLVPATPTAAVDRGLSPLCSDSELSLLVSEDESVPGTPQKLSSLGTTLRKDALINELRERCAALESEGSVLRQRLERMEDGEHNTQLTSELHEMSKSVADLHQRQNVEVLKLRTELAAAQAMLKGCRRSETRMEAEKPPPPPLPDQLSSPDSLQPQVSCPGGHSMQPQTPRPGGPWWICDGCEAQHEATSPVKRYRCFKCNYDLCTFCHEGKLEERRVLPEGVPPVGLGHEAQGAARCRQGHVLHSASVLDTGSKWMCDGCTRACDELGGSSRFRCAQCDFDLCLDCYASEENCKKDERDNEASGPVAEGKEPAVASATRSFTPEQLAFQRGRELWNNSVPRQRNGHSLEEDPWRKHECVAAAYAFRSMGQKRAASVEGERMRSSSRPSTPSFGSPCTDVPSSGSSLTSTSAQSSPSRPGPDVLALSVGRPPAPVITPPPPLHRHRVHVPPVSAIHPGGAGLDGSTGSTASSHQSTAGKQSEQPRPSVRTAAPATKEAFIHLHNEVAMPLMRRTADLGKAFQCLGEANALHIRLCGKASGEALYNMACCLSLGAAAVAAIPAGAVPGFAEDPAPGLPPARGEYATSQEHAEARLDRAIKLLEAAVELGYNNVANMTLDPDITALRDRRPQTFAAVVSRAHSLLAGPASTSLACRMPQMAPPVMWAKA